MRQPRLKQAVERDTRGSGKGGYDHGARLGVASAPFFVVRDERGETVYTSALQLIGERLGEQVTSTERARDVDPDDVGGI